MHPERTIGCHRIAEIHSVIRDRIRRTPVVEAAAVEFGLADRTLLTFTLEQLQHTGSCKLRGAFANLFRDPSPSPVS